VPQKSSSITDLRQSTDFRVKTIAIGEPRSLPAGQYAQEVFDKLEFRSKLNLNWYSATILSSPVIYRSGNADAGLVYITDTKTSNRVKVVATAANNLRPPIIYSVAVLKNSKNKATAREYIQFLSRNQSRSVFEKYGFTLAR
jgi:molybdate transport system substrate-binding protein